MRPFPVTVRCLALVGLGFGALPAFAQSANGMAAVPSYARVDLLGS
jgi:hypothetical protein